MNWDEWIGMHAQEPYLQSKSNTMQNWTISTYGSTPIKRDGSGSGSTSASK